MFWEHFGNGVVFAFVLLFTCFLLYCIGYLLYYTWKTNRIIVKVIIGASVFVLFCGLLFGVVSL